MPAADPSSEAGPKGGADEAGTRAGVDAGLSPRQRNRLARWDVAAKVATAVMPLVVAGVGYFVARSIAEIEVAPRFIGLAMDIIEEDPRNQPDGVREWAVDLLVEYSDVDLDPELTRRLEEGWSFSNPAQKVGTFSYAARESNAPVIDGHRFDLRFSIADDGGGRLEGLTLSLPASGETVSRDHLETTSLLRIDAGPVAYLFQLDAVEEPVARFTVWKQSPSLRPLEDEAQIESARNGGSDARTPVPPSE